MPSYLTGSITKTKYQCVNTVETQEKIEQFKEDDFYKAQLAIWRDKI